MARNYSNLYAGGALASGITNSATSVTLNTATGLPVAFPYTLTIDKGMPTLEVVTVVAASGVNLTVVRGQDGTAAVSHGVGAPVSHDHSARDFREPQLHMDATSVHGVSGAVVGTTDTQTLTNKDLTSPTNTLPSSVVKTTGAQAVTGKDFTSGNTFPSSLVTTSGTQLLTNKTITSPVIDGNVDLKGQVSSSAGAVEVNDALLVTGAATVGGALTAQAALTTAGWRVPYIQTGTMTVNVTSPASSGSAVLTYPQPFPGAPVVFVNVAGSSAYLATCATGAGPSSVTVSVRHVNDTAATVSLTVMWMAVYMP